MTPHVVKASRVSGKLRLSESLPYHMRGAFYRMLSRFSKGQDSRFQALFAREPDRAFPPVISA